MGLKPLSISKMEDRTKDVYEAVVVMSKRAKQVLNNRIMEKMMDAAIEDAVGEHICRCTGYVRYYRAIKQVVLATPGLTT